MSTTVLVKVDRLWCYRSRKEADLLEERLYADDVTPGPGVPYTVRAWRCALDPECNAKGLNCRLAQPGEVPPSQV